METPRVSRQILVVEDSTEVRRAIVQVLEIEHYTVHQAEHGKAALKKLEAMTPDLILSDINMPVMDGIAFYKELRKNSRWIPIPFIFLTANDSPEDIQAGRDWKAFRSRTRPGLYPGAKKPGCLRRVAVRLF